MPTPVSEATFKSGQRLLIAVPIFIDAEVNDGRIGGTDEWIALAKERGMDVDLSGGLKVSITLGEAAKAYDDEQKQQLCDDIEAAIKSNGDEVSGSGTTADPFVFTIDCDSDAAMRVQSKVERALAPFAADHRITDDDWFDDSEDGGDEEEKFNAWVENTYGDWSKFTDELGVRGARSLGDVDGINGVEEAVDDLLTAAQADFNESNMAQYCDDKNLKQLEFVSYDTDKMRVVIAATFERPPTDEEKKAFMEWLNGQMSDGWGEGAEQQSENAGDSDEYNVCIHYWNSRRNARPSEQIHVESTETVDSDVKAAAKKFLAGLQSAVKTVKDKVQTGVKKLRAAGNAAANAFKTTEAIDAMLAGKSAKSVFEDDGFVPMLNAARPKPKKVKKIKEDLDDETEIVTVPYRHYGRVFQCHVEPDTAAANAFMAANDGWGLLNEEPDGRCFIARMEDEGTTDQDGIELQDLDHDDLAPNGEDAAGYPESRRRNESQGTDLDDKAALRYCHDCGCDVRALDQVLALEDGQSAEVKTKTGKAKVSKRKGKFTIVTEGSHYMSPSAEDGYDPDEERATGQRDGIETYSCGDDDLSITTEEREEFEQVEGVTLEDDELSPEFFAALKKFVNEEPAGVTEATKSDSKKKIADLTRVIADVKHNRDIFTRGKKDLKKKLKEDDEQSDLAQALVKDAIASGWKAAVHHDSVFLTNKHGTVLSVIFDDNKPADVVLVGAEGDIRDEALGLLSKGNDAFLTHYAEDAHSL